MLFDNKVCGVQKHTRRDFGGATLEGGEPDEIIAQNDMWCRCLTSTDPYTDDTVETWWRITSGETQEAFESWLQGRGFDIEDWYRGYYVRFEVLEGRWWRINKNKRWEIEFEDENDFMRMLRIEAMGGPN